MGYQETEDLEGRGVEGNGRPVVVVVVDLEMAMEVT